MSAKDNDQFTYAGEALRSLFGRIASADRAAYSSLTSGWEDIVGREIAFHVSPKDIVHGVLLLETDHPGWAQKVRLSQYRILKDIQKKYPELEVRKMRIGVSSQRKTRGTADPIRPENSPRSPDESRDASGDRDFFELLEKMKRRAGS